MMIVTVCIKSYFYGVDLFDSSTVQYVYIDTWHGNITVQYNDQITFQWGVFVRFQNLNPSFSTLLAQLRSNYQKKMQHHLTEIQIGNDRQIVYSSPQSFCNEKCYPERGYHFTVLQKCDIADSIEKCRPELQHHLTMLQKCVRSSCYSGRYFSIESDISEAQWDTIVTMSTPTSSDDMATLISSLEKSKD